MPVGFRLCGKLLNRSFCGWLVFKRCGADVCVGWGVEIEVCVVGWCVSVVFVLCGWFVVVVCFM